MSVLSRDALEGAVCIITGGGTGIGLSTARLALHCGARVALCGRRAGVLAAAAEQLHREAQVGEKGLSKAAPTLAPAAATESTATDGAIGNIMWGTVDIREVDSCAAFAEKVIAKWGQIDVLVNNAGGQFPIYAEFLSSKGFNAVVRNNLLGTWNMTSAVARVSGGMLERQSGRIVNVIAQIVRGFPGMIHTGAARAGVDNMTKTLAIEWSRYNIKVNAVAPGVIVSSGTDQYGAPALERARAATPLRRTGTPEEVAILIAFLMSEKAASFITGQTYYIDGGQSLAGDMFQPENLDAGPYGAEKNARAKL